MPRPVTAGPSGILEQVGYEHKPEAEGEEKQEFEVRGIEERLHRNLKPQPENYDKDDTNTHLQGCDLQEGFLAYQHMILSVVRYNYFFCAALIKITGKISQS
jgi:hypothetical protein